MRLNDEIISEFNRFFKRARECGEQEPTAMILATSDGAGLVTSRTVLLKALDERRERIAEGLAASDKAEKELEAAKLTVEEQIREARSVRSIQRITLQHDIICLHLDIVVVLHFFGR